jgi:hypothetical protein
MKFSLILLISLLVSGCWTLEEGEKVGQIVDVHKSGFFVKTWECRLIRGGLDDGSGTIGTKLDLTIENDYVAHKAIEFMKDKKNVIIKYHQEFFTFLRSDSNNYFLDFIEIEKELEKK